MVGTVASPNGLEEFAPSEAASHCDVVEFRLDSIPAEGLAIANAMVECPLPVIATARHPEEGGEGALDPDARATLLVDAMPHVDCVDIEVQSLSDLKHVLTRAQDAGTMVLASFHDFERTPSSALLESKIEAAMELGADAVKFATRLNNISDLCRLISLLEIDGRPPICVMGMGELGQASRLLAAQCGSFLNYGYLTAANAPGQWRASELKRILAEWQESIPSA